jgi:hypothetical protein
MHAAVPYSCKSTQAALVQEGVVVAVVDTACVLSAGRTPLHERLKVRHFTVHASIASAVRLYTVRSSQR